MSSGSSRKSSSSSSRRRPESKHNQEKRHKRKHPEEDRRSRKYHKALDEKLHSKWDDEFRSDVHIKKEPESDTETLHKSSRLDVRVKKEPESDVERKYKPQSSGNFKEKWGKTEEPVKPIEKEKINFGLSGKLTEDANTYKGVVIKYSQPPEARKPKRRWRWYIFKGEEEIPYLPLHRSSAYLIGRDRVVADIPIDHPSCSKQHAVLQYRLVNYDRPDGTTGRTVKPYLIDLESANGTFLNKKRIDAKRYVELVEKDVVNFGYSSRDYVLLHEASKGDEEDDQINSSPELSPVSMLLRNQ